ncbi:hypothetical protein V8F20_003084 [Naviculisporaceae sp. PSN 640]
MDSIQDSPTIGRSQVHYSSSPPSSSSPTYTNSPSTTFSSRSTRKPAPSPLHTTSNALSSPPTSPGPTRSGFSSPLHDTYTTAAAAANVPQIVTTAAPDDEDADPSAKTYFNSDSSGANTPEDRRSPAPSPNPPTSRIPNESRSVSDPVVNSKPQGGATPGNISAMAGSSSVRAEVVGRSAPRNSSMDSAISAISSRSNSNKNSQDSTAGTPDIANLIKTAGSPEAVIQYLLKEKQSQSQQNAQLWRLVDKQRAMILGLNKDLERALKDKEKYRKKLKEFVSETGVPPVPVVPAERSTAATSSNAASTADSPPKEQVLEVPGSPGLDSDSQKHSPIDVALAPYPITPPADQPSGMGSADQIPASVGELLDPSHSMPKPSEHAYDQYDHDAQERAAEAAKRQAEESKDLKVNMSIPPSRSLPREPPRMPPPQPPAGPPERMQKLEEGIAQFPPPPVPPPRKPPPAPLSLKNIQSPTLPAEDAIDSDTDYDDILEVDEIPHEDRRGRRRTREEDEREREILARKEAEARSLSKKSKKSSSQKGTPKEEIIPPTPQNELPPSPRLVNIPKALPLRQQEGVGSLAGVLSGTQTIEPRTSSLPQALLSPGLPSSPRPMALKSPVNSPPLSPLGVSTFGGMPLSPRPPRAPIPLPPNTPLHTPSPGNALPLSTPKPLTIVKKSSDSVDTASPTKSTHEGVPEVQRTKVYKGLVTEEYPDLLLPPNALPSIDIKVASSRMKPSRASLISMTQLEEDPVFTLAIFSRADGGELWRVEKDSASLAKLDQRLKQCPAFTAKTPDRSLFSGHAPAKLDARRVALNHYLDELLNTPLDNATALELCKYLSTNTLPPNADETGTSADVGPVESAQKTGPGGRPFRSGYLTKRGKNFGGWKARFFILDGPHLKYYETPGGAHLGTIKLQKAQIGKQSPQQTSEGSPGAGGRPGVDDMDNQYRHAFLILEPKKKDPNSMTKHVLCAESDRERDIWVDALLRWIDYKDPDEEELPHPHAKKDSPHDRNHSEKANGNTKKKSRQGKSQQQHHHQNDSTGDLVGMSYEATKQGELPTRGKQSPHDDESGPPSGQSQLSISAPRDPQVISNTEAWGSKLGMGLAPPNQEEKKARKRSFFGFGPKTRTSSDGQDSLFGSDSGASGAGQVQGGGGQGGPVRQVFGASLAEAVRYCSPVNVNVPLPAVVYRCIQYLDAQGAIAEEGIFRLSGSNVVIKQLKERFNNEGDINLLAEEQYHDIHAVASLLKAYLRELPTSILTRDLHVEFLTVTEMTNMQEKLAALGELVTRLPQANATLLKYLIAFLIKIIDHADLNKMTVRNVGIVFSPTLNIPAPVFALLLQNYKAVFGIEPSEYELPTKEPSIISERRPSLPMERPSFQQERRPSDGRPSTSHSDSPHRQRLMEAVDAQTNRSSPTPPPVMSMQQMAQMNAAQMAARSTPTPPPQRQHQLQQQLNVPQYDVSYHQGQGGGSHASMRPAYESGFTVPQGFDVSQLHASNGFKPNPGYDRPLYENGGGLAPAPAYDQPYGSKANRRESTMFMGNLTHQGSKSRLREESQF